MPDPVARNDGGGVGAARVSGVRPPAPLETGAQSRNDWIRWKEDWDDYAVVQDIASKPDVMQCSLFRIALGADGKKLLRNQPVPMDPAKDDGTALPTTKMTTLMIMMVKAVVGEVNNTYERYVFRCRVQQKGESVDDFILALRELQKTCDVCEHMTERFLKDQVIYGVSDDAIKEKLLQERDLTLAKCLDMCRAAESASAQARDMNSGSSAEVNRVAWQRNKFDHNKSGWKSGARCARPKSKPGQQDGRECNFCGLWHEMAPGVCPALGKTCGKCGQLDHFARRCSPEVNLLDTADSSDEAVPSGYGDIDAVMHQVGAVTHQVCGLPTGPKAKLRVQGKTKAFLLDTGASANLISSHDVDTRKLKLMRPGRKFTMWNGSTQEAMGMARITVYNPVTQKEYVVNFHVVPAKLAPILGCSTVQEMGLVQVCTGNYESVYSVVSDLNVAELTELQQHSVVSDLNVAELTELQQHSVVSDLSVAELTELQQQVKQDVSSVVADLSVAELTELQQHVKQDVQMSRLLMMVREGWPQCKVDCDPLVTPYWDSRDELSIYDGVLVKGQALVIPRQLRGKYLEMAHAAHQGADSCVSRRARESLFWPGMSADPRAAVQQCEACARYVPRQQNEPLHQLETPEKAWSCVSADRMVVKSMTTKGREDNADVYSAPLNYRNIPRTTTGLSPAEVLMQRNTRTATLPQQPSTSAADRKTRGIKEKRRRQVNTHRDHTAAPLAPIPVGSRLWYAHWKGTRESWARGQITDVCDGRLYFITTSSGAQYYRRNRAQVKPDLTPKPHR